MKNLYIIAGPNGAGKTTASYTILPEIFHCKEFVNADEIARGLSPFNEEAAAFQAGRIMLNRINELLETGESFAFETTLASKTFVGFIERAKEKGYKTTLLFLALDNSEMAIDRVKTRVQEGGHHIPKNVIIRRFENGLKNLFNLYQNVVDEWMLVDNSVAELRYIADKFGGELSVQKNEKWNHLMETYEK